MTTLNANSGLFVGWLIVGLGACSLTFAAASQGITSPDGSQPAANGSTIVFTGDRASQDEPDQLYVMKADGTGEQLVTVAALRGQLGDCLALQPRLSPNGRQIAFNCGPDIWLTDGITVTRLANNGRVPSWSPDGQQIAFGSVTQPFGIYIINSDGTDLRGPLINGNSPDWSPNSQWLLFARLQTVFVIAIDDLFNHPENAIQLTNTDRRYGFDVNPRWSPNGRTIVFERAPDNLRHHTRVVVMNPDEPEPLSTPDTITTPDEDLVPRLEEVRVPHQAFPSWSPDGHWLLFQRLLCDPTLNHTNPQNPPNGSDLFAVALDAEADGSHREVRLTFGACPGPPGPGEPFGTFVPQTSSLVPKSTFSAWASWAPGRTLRH